MKYQNITTNDMLNGQGLRVVLWVSGCSHYCAGCHNPLTWNPDDGLEFDAAAKEEIFTELGHSYIQGLTLSGGDPMYSGNRDTMTAFAKEVKEKFPYKDIWMYTGFCLEEIKDEEILQYIDVLVDGEFVEGLKDNSLHWKGSKNQKVINVRTLSEIKEGKDWTISSEDAFADKAVCISNAEKAKEMEQVTRRILKRLENIRI